MAQVAHLRRRIEPQIAVLRAHADWEHADDPVEALHRLRVATRRLRAFVRVFSPMLGDKRARRLRKRLRSVTRGVGPLREWDVLLQGLRTAHATADPLLRAALEHVIAQSEAQRHEAAEHARHAVARVDMDALAQTLDRRLDGICGRLLRLDDRLPAHAWSLLEPQFRRAFDQLPQPHPTDQVEALHDIRTRAKRLRYALELFKPTLGDAYRPLRKPTKRIQRALGEHHDASLLAALVRKQREALAAQGLHTLAEGLESLEARLLERQHRFHDKAQPALELLDGGRYGEIAQRALGVNAEARNEEPGTSLPEGRATVGPQQPEPLDIA